MLLTSKIRRTAGAVFGVKMWGDRSSHVKLTGDFDRATEGSKRAPVHLDSL
jgi:hypothetical protein